MHQIVKLIIMDCPLPVQNQNLKVGGAAVRFLAFREVDLDSIPRSEYKWVALVA